MPTTVATPEDMAQAFDKARDQMAKIAEEMRLHQYVIDRRLDSIETAIRQLQADEIEDAGDNWKLGA